MIKKFNPILIEIEVIIKIKDFSVVFVGDKLSLKSVTKECLRTSQQ